MKTIIAGSRTITDYEWLKECIGSLDFEITEVVSGCACGVDSMGERWAAENGLPVEHFPAQWHTHGRKAGPLRNAQMAEYAEALVLLWDGKSRGSQDMLNRARSRGLLVRCFCREVEDVA